jgi:uncharacterized lipoprotein YbaY
LDKILITGTILFSDDVAPFSQATAHIRLLDVSKMDAPHETIAQQQIKDIKYPSAEKIDFSLKGRIKDQRGTYIVSVHIDVDGDGQISTGDYITTGYYEVPTVGNTTGLNVKVYRVSS